MRAIGLDLGTKTLGISISDTTMTIASTLKTIHYDGDTTVLLPLLKALITEYDITTIVLGLPKNMNNSLGDRAKETIAFKEQLESYLGTLIELQDERLSTVEANHLMITANMSRKKRKVKVDSLAANIILQTYLDKKKRGE